MNPSDIKIQELETRVTELEQLYRSMLAAPEIDPQISRANALALTGTSAKTAGSATQAVDESGAGTYNVMVPPDGFIDLGGKNVPYID